MVNLWKKATAVSLLAAALLSGGAPGLSANAGTPVVSETISAADSCKRHSGNRRENFSELRREVFF